MGCEGDVDLGLSHKLNVSKLAHRACTGRGGEQRAAPFTMPFGPDGMHEVGFAKERLMHPSSGAPSPPALTIAHPVLPRCGFLCRTAPSTSRSLWSGEFVAAAPVACLCSLSRTTTNDRIGGRDKLSERSMAAVKMMYLLACLLCVMPCRYCMKSPKSAQQEV